MKEHAREMGVKGINIKGIQIFEFEMMIHVIHTRTKIDLSNMHTHMNSRTSMLFNILDITDPYILVEHNLV